MVSLRWDIAAALAAVIVSFCALFVSLYQTRIMRSEQATSLWPYLTVAIDNRADEFGIVVLNLGVGPAIVRSARVAGSQGLVKTWNEAIKAAEPDAKIQYYTESLLNQWVFPAGSRQRVVVIPNDESTAAIRDYLTNATIDLCYCSLLDECWTISVNPGSANIDRKRQQCRSDKQLEFLN